MRKAVDFINPKDIYEFFHIIHMEDSVSDFIRKLKKEIGKAKLCKNMVREIYIDKNLAKEEVEKIDKLIDKAERMIVKLTEESKKYTKRIEQRKMG